MKNIGQVFLFLSHLSDGIIIKEFKNLRRSAAHLGESFFLYDTTGKTVPEKIARLSPYFFSNECMHSLGYPLIDEKILPGHAHFPVFNFYLDKPQYGYYWLIEYDVRFSGEWRFFFESFFKTDADLLTSYIRLYEEQPNWYWWELTHPQKSIPLQNRICSFNPIYRISNSALSFLHQAFKSGWRGHHEVALPTLLHHHGFTIQDICVNGKYAVPGMYNNFCSGNHEIKSSGDTVRYRPVFWRYGREKNKLYHPVKPFITAMRDNINYRRSVRGRIVNFINMFRK